MARSKSYYLKYILASCLFYFKLHKLFRPSPVLTSSFISNSLKSLRENGFASINLTSLLSDSELNSLYEYVTLSSSSSFSSSNKRFLTYHIGNDFSKDNIFSVDSKNPVLPLIYSPILLSIAQTYFQTSVKPIHFTLATTHTSTSSTPCFSQRWHSDPGIIGCLKFFVYFSDVSNANGPFEYLSETHKNGLMQTLCSIKSSKRFGGSFYPDPILLHSLMPKKTSFIGSKGTAFLVDTSGFHRGGFCDTGSRIMSTTTFYPSLEPIKSKVKISLSSLS